MSASVKPAAAGSAVAHATSAATAAAVDAERYPRTARMVADLFDADTDVEFDRGLRVILAGILATRSS